MKRKRFLILCLVVLIFAGNYTFRNVGPALALVQWSPISSMTDNRIRPASALLNDGRVFVCGGLHQELPSGALSYLDSVEIYNPSNDTWSVVAPMTAPRESHTATTLLDGRVLVVAGSSGTTLAGAEVYDPNSNSWSATGPMHQLRQNHTATLLTDGRVVVTGGFVSSAEIYDPATNSWSSAGAMSVTRMHHRATLLNDGRLLVTGGRNEMGSGPSLSSAEIYNATSNSWSIAPPMSSVRAYHTSTILSDGRVLVTGGALNGNGLISSSAEIYDPSSNTWITTAPLSQPRLDHTATKLDNGQVLIAGGAVGSIPNEASSNKRTEIYDVGTNRWLPAGSLSEGRIYSNAIKLNDGRVLIVGGVGTFFSSNGEIFNRTDSADNHAPLPQCQNVTLNAGLGCFAFASINDGSSDPDGDPLILSQSPSGPYPMGDTQVTLTAIDSEGVSAQCSATVTVTEGGPAHVFILGPSSGASFPVGTTVDFRGAFGSDQEETYTGQWRFGSLSTPAIFDRPTGTITASYTFNTAGVYDVELSVSDQCGHTGRATTLLGEPGDPPARVVITNTSPGTNVAVTEGNTTLTFATISTAGLTTVKSIDPLTIGEVPGGFAVSELIAYQIATTAEFMGGITIAFVIPGPISEEQFNSLAILHNENGNLVDVTAASPARDYPRLTIYANTTSLSPFYLVRRNRHVAALFDQTKAYKLGSTVPIKLQLEDAANNNVSSSGTILTARNLTIIGGSTSAEVIDAGNANPDNNFRYVPTLGGSGGGYIFNLSTKGLRSGNYILSLYSDNDHSFFHTVRFEVK